MPLDNRALINEIRNSIKSSNKKTGAKISYNQVYEMVRNALASEAQEDLELTKCYCEIIKIIAEEHLSRRAMMKSNVILDTKYSRNPGVDYTIVNITEDVKNWVESIGMIVNPSYMANHPITEDQLRTIRDYQLAFLKSSSYYGEIPKCLKSWGRDCFYSEINRIDDIFNDPDIKDTHTFKGDLHDKKDIAASEIYYKTVLVREELENLGKFWRFIYFRYVKACNAFLEKADSTLAKIGFKESEHRDVAMDILKETIMPPNHEDKYTVVDAYCVASKQAKGISNGRGSRAHDRHANAQLLDCKYETSFDKVLEPYNEKYGADLTAVALGYSEAEVDTIAEGYDKSKNTDNINNAISQAFNNALTKIYISVLKNGMEINATEILKDARKIAILAAQRYTLYFEIEENLELESPAYMKDKNEDYFNRKIDECANKATLMLKMEEDQARRRGKAVPSHILKNKDAITKEKISALKSEIISASNQLFSNRKEMLEEDKKLAVSLGSKLPKPKPSGVRVGEYEPKPIKNPTAENLDSWKPFLDINYKPNLQKDLKMQYSMLMEMKETLIDGNKNVPNDVKKVVELTKNKLLKTVRAMGEAKQKSVPFGEADMKTVCEKLENELKKTLPEYKQKSPEELLELRNQQLKENIKLTEADLLGEGGSSKSPRTDNTERKNSTKTVQAN